jgi:hypothetical protein
MSYEHPTPPTDLRNLHHAMDYNAAGQPVIRVINSQANANADGRVDAFGRQRVAMPFTLFDSQQRYSRRDDQWATALVGSGNVTYNVNQSTTLMTVTNASGDKVTRETKRVFPYQPGKSLQVMTTFVMDEGQTGLAQRVGYFNSQNGVFFSNKNGVNYIVLRSYISGSAQDTEIAQENWNVDKLDGTTATGVNLDVTKAQIFFMDMEWLGVGQVRTGFVIDGNFYLAHVFQHANIIDSVYITTATLPVRYEIENITGTVAGSEMKQICSTVISEGGYELRGRPYSVGRPVTAPMNLDNAGTFYPVASIRLNSNSLDAVAIIKNISMLGIANNGRMQYKLVANATINDGTWINVTESLVDYNITANTMSGGETLTSGYVGINNQSGQTITLDPGAFSFQLSRNGLTNTAITYTLAVAAAADNDDALGSIDWEELF